MRVTARRLSALTLVWTLTGCGQNSSARPQWLVVLNTDLALVGQLAGDPTLAPDGTIDTVRIDQIDQNGTLGDVLEVVAPDVSDWPVSFGVSRPIGGSTSITLRVRAFRGQLASAGESGGRVVLEPPASVTVDRIVALGLPTGGVQTVEVFLAADCMGIAPNFETLTTCLGDVQRNAPASDGLVSHDDPADVQLSLASWKLGREEGCKLGGDPERLCVPGGFSMLGDLDAVGLADGLATPVDPVPLRPVFVSPFLMDRTEFTVRRFKDVVTSSTAQLSGAPSPYDPLSQEFKHCTWLGPNDAGTTNDDLPLNCVTHFLASELCAAVGGSLPTEAQWEFAARGRGQRRNLPWGNASPNCCTASLGRDPGANGTCPGEGPEPAGAHASDTSCATVDVTRDGLADFGGSMTELMRDTYAPYDDPCWSGGVLINPVCEDPGSAIKSLRGANWRSALGGHLSVSRQFTVPQVVGIETGFRCAYPDGGS